jgi:hypothetical protein
MKKLIKPMLAEDSTLFKKDLFKFNITSSYINSKEYILEPKYDGSRYILQWDEN